MGLLDGKTAIVTGAARGIGKAIALKFAQEGANIAFTDLVIDENAEATAKEIEALGVKAKAYASNAASFEDTAKVVEAIHADFGRIDILVNNAGITRDGLMMRMTEQQWDMVIAPGFIMTAMTDALSEEVKAEWCKKIPLRRGGTPEDVANIATFLASDMSSYVSGQVIQVDGGMNM